ncbi:protein tyrosine phosphatase domain-containing protein 1 [Trichomycterus rosablanca]|uniref:protein tyrosine phosphatase domain-containing protein 1 n=1 Tax=Trichomycterus rosablanca TaxID=2290929 RepID=UPI002F357EAC
MTSLVPVPKPSYSPTREALVKAIPSKVICLLACGGRDCRYEGPACWRPSQQAIKGLFSSWVTDDIVAMARPSTHLIKRYNMIDQFKKLNIKSIINMQLPGEHTHCGPELDPDSGFTYSPQIFMENQIYFYNFGMPDFGVSSLEGMLDAVKVLAFSVQEGKVAVHCHAGLGRTGVLIACYLIYTLRISASEAVHYVRIKRPRSIQTRAQIDLVFDFARLLGFTLAQFPCQSLRHGTPFSLGQYLQHQALLLHGKEAQQLMYTPKILHLLCSLLVTLCQEAAGSPEVQVELKRKASILDLQRVVRATLVLRRYLPVLIEEEDSYESVSSCVEPFGFLERKRNVLLNKRSYSDSDLSKISLNEGTEFIHSFGLFKEGDKLSNGIIHYLKDEKSINSAINATVNTSDCVAHKCPPVSPSNSHISKSNSGKKANRLMNKFQPFPPFSSNTELCKNHRTCKLSIASRAVANTMAQQEPPGDKILQRAALLQKELNVSAYGWATLAKETDPKVLSALMWDWLEKLKEPLLSAGDINNLINIPGQNPLIMLNKSQRCTLCCLLDCIARVTAQCPQFTNAILLRLIQALTKCSTEMANHVALLKMFEAKIKDLRRLSQFRLVTGVPVTNKTSFGAQIK